MFRSLVVGAAVFAAVVVVGGSALGMQRAFAGALPGGSGARAPAESGAPAKDRYQYVSLNAQAGTFPGNGPGPVDAMTVSAGRDTTQPTGSLWVYHVVGMDVVCDGGWLGFQGVIFQGYGTATVDVTVPERASASGTADTTGYQVDDCQGIWEPTSLSGPISVGVSLQGGDGRIHEVASHTSSMPWGDYTWQGKTRGASGAGELSLSGPAQAASGWFFEHQNQYSFKPAPQGSMTGMKFITALAAAAAGPGAAGAANDSYRTAYISASWQEVPLSAPASVSPPEPVSEPVRVRYGNAFAQQSQGKEGWISLYDVQGLETDCGGYTMVRGLMRQGSGPASVAVQGMRSAEAEGVVTMALYVVDCSGTVYLGVQPVAVTIALENPSESWAWKSNVVVTFPDGSGYHANNMSREAYGGGRVTLDLAEIDVVGNFGASRSQFQYHE